MNFYIALLRYAQRALDLAASCNALLSFLYFHKFFGRYFDIYVFKYRYKTLVSVKLHYGTKNFLFTYLVFKKTHCTRETALDLPKIVKYAFHYNENCLFGNFIHYFWRYTNSNFVHFKVASSKCMYIIMVDRGRINIMQKFFQNFKVYCYIHYP